MKKTILTTASVLALGAGSAWAQEVYDLGELVITATLNPTEEGRIGTSVEVLDGDDLAASGDVQLSDTLRRLPGVSVTQTGPTGTTANLRLRGSAERFTAVYIDGIKVNDPSATDSVYGNFGALGLGGLSRVEVLKGSQSALYGGSAVAGVVNIFTLPDADTPEGVSQRAEVQFGSFGTVVGSYSYVQKTGELTLNFGISHAQSDGFSAADEDLGNTEDDGFNETRLTFGAALQATETLRVGINGFVGRQDADFDEFGFVPEDGTPGDETGSRDEEGLRIYAEIDAGGAWQHDLSLAYYRVERVQNSLTTSAPFASPFTSVFEGERLRFEYLATGQISDKVTLNIGIDAQEETATYANLAAGSETIETYGAFAEVKRAITQDLDVIGSVRIDDHSRFGTETTRRVALSWRAQPGVTLRGAAATGYRAPSIDELFGDYPAFFFAGNPNLQPETSVSYEVGVDLDIASGGVFSATLFQTDIENLIALDGSFSSLENKPGISTRKGLELSLQMPLSDAVDLTAAYTLLDAKQASGARLARIPRHELAIGIDADLGSGWGGTLDFVKAADIADDTFPAQAIADYSVVDASVSYAITDTAEAYLRVHNLLDEQYQTSAGYGTSGRAVFVGLRASF